jgi:chromosomal replication initiation ATPase DnaA
MTAGPQLALAFDHRPSLSGDDFLVAPNNAEAVGWIDRWPDWPGPALVVFGPPGCGRTHLAHVFQTRSGARSIGSADLGAAEARTVLGDARAIVLDDADAMAGPALERGLLHLHTAIEQEGRFMLLTARSAPSRWLIALADLSSRLKAAPVVEIGPPDDALIAAVLVKLFADRQLRVTDDVIQYALARMDRTVDAARGLVAAADSTALAERRNITVPLVRRILAGSADGP